MLYERQQLCRRANTPHRRKCLILFNWLEPLTSILDQHSAEDTLTGRFKGPRKKKPLLHTFLHASPPTLLELVNGISDDIATFSRIGLIGKRIGERAAYYADWCWFSTTLVNLVENGVERSVIIEQKHQGRTWFLSTFPPMLIFYAVESRLYTESMTGATAKSNPTANRLDGKELSRLQRQDYWIMMSRWKLLMDLIFVCEFTVGGLRLRFDADVPSSIQCLQFQASEELRADLHRTGSRVVEVRRMPMCCVTS